MNEFLKQNNLFPLEDSVDKLPIEDLRRYYCENLRDQSNDDFLIRKLAARVLPEIDVEGDSYGVPGITEIVEKLVLMIEQLELEKNI